MAATFEQTSKDQLEAIRRLTAEAFHVSLETASIDRALLEWKYYDAGPDWKGSRSYVLSDKGKLLAHAAIWPLRLRVGGVVRCGISFCDWAADEEQRGIGLVLLKKLVALAPFVLVIGGAEITRQVLPKFGFKEWADLPVLARVIRPLKQAATRSSWDWKEPARLARNTAWSFRPLAPVPNWTAEPALPNETLLSRVHDRDGSVNDRNLLAFFERCPAVPIRCLVLSKSGVPAGYAVLSTVGGQGRIAELRLVSDEQEDWTVAVALLVILFRQDKKVAEVTAIGSAPLLHAALSANGFRARESRPLVVLDREGDMTAQPVPQLGMLIDDASFLFFPDSPYLT